MLATTKNKILQKLLSLFTDFTFTMYCIQFYIMKFTFKGIRIKIV